MEMTIGKINFGPALTTIPPRDEVISELRAELDMMLRTLEIIQHLNSMGKTIKIDEEIKAILNHYNR